MTHKRKDCLERPRKVGAAKTNKNIAGFVRARSRHPPIPPPEADRLHGFDASDYSRVVDRFERAEKLKEEAAKKRELERAYAEANGGKGDARPGRRRGSRRRFRTRTTLTTRAPEKGDADAQGFMKVNKRVRTAGGGRR